MRERARVRGWCACAWRRRARARRRHRRRGERGGDARACVSASRQAATLLPAARGLRQRGRCRALGRRSERKAADDAPAVRARPRQPGERLRRRAAHVPSRCRAAARACGRAGAPRGDDARGSRFRGRAGVRRGARAWRRGGRSGGRRVRGERRWSPARGHQRSRRAARPLRARAGGSAARRCAGRLGQRRRNEPARWRGRRLHANQCCVRARARPHRAGRPHAGFAGPQAAGCCRRRCDEPEAAPACGAQLHVGAHLGRRHRVGDAALDGRRQADAVRPLAHPQATDVLRAGVLSAKGTCARAVATCTRERELVGGQDAPVARGDRWVGAVAVPGAAGCFFSVR